MRDNPFKRRMEAVADIAFIAGGYRYHSDDSRKDIEDFILWAEEFETHRVCPPDGEETYLGKDYMTAIEEFALSKLKQDGDEKSASQKANALEGFLKVMGDGYLAHDIGPKLSCFECDALESLLRTHGYEETADALLESHALEDEEGDNPRHLTLRDKLRQDQEDVPF